MIAGVEFLQKISVSHSKFVSARTGGRAVSQIETDVNRGERGSEITENVRLSFMDGPCRRGYRNGLLC